MRTLVTLLLMLTAVCIEAQTVQQPTKPVPGFPGGIRRFPSAIDPATGLPVKEQSEPETRFDLEFEGGTPGGLVQAVEGAGGMPLNVIIPKEHERFLLPPLKLRNVTVPQMFSSLGVASAKTEIRLLGNNYQSVKSSYGFRSPDQFPNANSIWYFYVEDPGLYPSPPPPPAQCRFWQLEPYLEKLKVEDITTAIETGWKMQGVNPAPKLSFHKDTKLLIGCGQREHLTIVDDVLRELTPARKAAKDIPMPGQGVSTAGEKPSKQ